MACIADVNLQLRLGRTGNEGVTAGALDGAVHILGMNTLLHVGFSFSGALVSDQDKTALA